MTKITGVESNIPDKVQRLYTAVMELIDEGEDISTLRVSTITDRAGIGKGTAYEYFKTKEEIVSCAVVYTMKQAFQGIISALNSKATFSEQLEVLLDEVEKTGDNRVCFFNFVHFMTDRSEFSILVREKMDSEDFEKITPSAFLRAILEGALERGEIKSEESVQYMTFFLFSQLVSFMMALTSQKNMAGMNHAEIRNVVRKQVSKEFGL